jgi:S-adenosylmethionine:tRNA ribosyltransferase-isomerase
MRIDELDYFLPPKLIATQPAEPRDSSRLLVYRRATDTVEHRHFRDLPELLEPTDLLVVNDTRVLPAKLLLRKATGASIPGIYLLEQAPGHWEVMLRSRGKLAPGMTLATDPPSEFSFRLRARGSESGHWLVSVETSVLGSQRGSAAEILARIGHVPLPPYIEKARTATPGSAGTGVGNAGADESADRAHYQTVYAQAQNARSLAAPTAGLHFTPELLGRLTARGIQIAKVTLHVGLGTFLPVGTATLEEHKMHTEEYAIPAATIATLRAQRAAGKRIVVVGTTATRTLEAAAASILDLQSPPTDLVGSTDLLIAPGYQFALTDALITNFHLPRSTLLALVGALTGLERLKALYSQAIADSYRFYSYGDAMLIL